MARKAQEITIRLDITDNDDGYWYASLDTIKHDDQKISPAHCFASGKGWTKRLALLDMFTNAMKLVAECEPMALYGERHMPLYGERYK